MVGDSAASPQRSPIVEVTAGVAAGCGGRLVEHPFDTVKVRVQAGWEGCKTSTQALSATIRLHGARGLYTGLLAPLLGASFEAGVLFAAQAAFKDVAQNKLGAAYLPAHMIGGGLSGGLAAFILTPVELIKCRAQAGMLGPSGTSWGLTRAILATEGIQGLYVGHTATLIREIPGTAVWFGAYHAVLQALTAYRGEPLHAASASSVIMSGALGGCSYWLLMYPVDTVKSMLQISATAAELGMVGTAVALVRGAHATGGATAVMRRLYGGLGPTLVKAVPGNAAIFGIYELGAQLLSSAER